MEILSAAGEMLAFATSPDVARCDLAERRRRALVKLGELTEATAGFWAWGHGHPYRSPSLPVALIHFGLTDEQLGGVANIGLSKELDLYFRQPIAARLADRSLETTLSSQVREIAYRQNLSTLYSFMDDGGWTDWMHSVRYSAGNNWSNLFLLRGDNEFQEAQQEVVNFVMQNCTWLHSATHDNVSDEMLIGLTNRQQSVTLLLLDGMSRKMIAKRLSLSEDTVGDHIKAIYQHFKVNSATELAALFLRRA